MLGIVVVPEGFDVATPVGGLPPLVRHALSLQAAGAREVRFVGPVVPPSHPRLRIPVSAGGPFEGPAIVLPAGVTVHRSLPARIARTPPKAGEVLSFGTGAHACFSCGAGSAESVVEALAAGRTPVATPGVLAPGEFVLPALRPEERRASMRAHLRSLLKPTAGLLDRTLMRPISLRITRLLASTPVTPNQISILCLGLALCAAALVSSSRPVVAATGALLFVVMRIVDCVDGELARLRYQSSRFGEWLDTVGDGIGIVALIGAVTWRLHREEPHRPWLLVGAVGIALYAVVQGLQYVALARSGKSGSLQTVEWAHRVSNPGPAARFLAQLEVLLRIDFISVLFAVLVLVRRLDVLLVVHTVTALGVAAYFGVEVARRRHTVRPERTG